MSGGVAARAWRRLELGLQGSRWAGPLRCSLTSRPHADAVRASEAVRGAAWLPRGGRGAQKLFALQTDSRFAPPRGRKQQNTPPSTSVGNASSRKAAA